MKSSGKCPFDSFHQLRAENDVVPTEFAGESIKMVMGYKDVRSVAKDWGTFSSKGKYMVPIPSEAEFRSVQQFPIETDPGEHKEYRKIVDPYFRRPLDKDYKPKIDALIEQFLLKGLESESVEVVGSFALPIQSIALTHLLDMPEEAAQTWIEWGTEIYLEGGEVAKQKGMELEEYIQEMFDKAEANPGTDIFSALNTAEFQGRLLTTEEKVGTMVLVFAGGRDTVINSLSSIIRYFSDHPEKITTLDDDKKVIMATEEFFRAISPLTQIGRHCPVSAEFNGHHYDSGQRVSLNWASANYDERIFADPDTVKLDRKPNPHIAFGSGVHNCLGAHHARLLIRSFLSKLYEMRMKFELVAEVPRVESETHYDRIVGYRSLNVKFSQETV